VHHGFFDHAPGSAENERVLAAINAARPDLLLVNMGMPRQEAWLAENWHSLDVRVAITAGALVDHVAGRVKRPPAWVADAGLEWAVRLALEPGRLWRRYLLGLPRFAALVAVEKIRRSARKEGAAM
jgi:N-acetylglucosaminyldiphosphoundecaprenol N-acetyl-beta-D-mannosaminyltransferase